MQQSRRGLLVAVAMIAGGLVLFFLYLGVSGIDPDQHPLGLLDWVIAGALIGPGFAYLINWRRQQDRARAGRLPGGQG